MLLLAACSGGERAAPTWPELLDVERLAFVPAGVCLVRGVDCSTSVDLLVDRFEVTRGEWQGRARTHPSAAPAVFLEGWTAETATLPATGMTLAEASAYAAGRGMRLPTAAEWMLIAAGTRAQRWPWGTVPRDSVANTSDLGLGALAKVGTFESGSTPAGVHDLVGNAWEWVRPPLPLFASEGAAVAPSFGARLQYPHWAMGGSYLTRTSPLHGSDREDQLFFLAIGLSPDHRAADIGFRCVAAADDFLWARARAWDAFELEPRLRAVGASRSWRRRSVPLLEGLVARPGAPRSLGWLLAGARQ